MARDVVSTIKPLKSKKGQAVKLVLLHLERETGFPVDPYPIDSTEVFGTPLCLTDWIMYYPCCLGKRFLTTPLQVLVFWSYRLFILPDHCLHAPGQQQPCGD